jgi:Kelch motif
MRSTRPYRGSVPWHVVRGCLAMAVVVAVALPMSGPIRYAGEPDQHGPVKWREGELFPGAQSLIAPSAAAVERTMVVAYGRSGTDTNAAYTYDPESDTWKRVADAPLPARSEAAGVSDGGYFYSVGGSSASGVLSDFERYDPLTDTWVSLPDMPTPRAGLAAVFAVDEGIYAIGGRAKAGPCAGSELDTVERYDIATQTWSSQPPLLSPRSDLAASNGEALLATQIMVFGGCRRDSDGRTRFLNDVDNFSSGFWTKSPADLPVPRAGAAATDPVICGGFGEACWVFVVGGWNRSGTVTTTDRFYWTDNAWSGAEPMPTPRAMMGTALFCDPFCLSIRFFTVGGATSRGAGSNTNEYIET